MIGGMKGTAPLIPNLDTSHKQDTKFKDAEWIYTEHNRNKDKIQD